MSALDELLASIRTGPSGPKIGAFFDYEALLARSGFDEHEIAGFAGRTEDEMAKDGAQRFNHELAGQLFHGAWRLVREHVNRGHSVVLVASPPRFHVAPLARELGIAHVVCTELHTKRKVLTGRVAGKPLVGDAKLAAVRRFAARQAIELADSHGYAHRDADAGLLDAVGLPHPVNPGRALARHGNENGWAALQFERRRDRRDPVPVIRTAALLGALLTAGGTGFLTGIACWNRRRGVDVASWLFGRAGTSLGDIKIEVTGAENLWSHRPAVFFGNHQSTMIDILILARVLEHGFTFVAKAEVRDMPVIGAMFDLADVAFVDRADREKALSALQPAVEKLRSGTSIAIAPEGTRSLSPKIGTFKKGGFHLARDARVPIVPMVVRNAGEIMWRNAVLAQPGTIDVAVHEPLPTAGWAKEDIDGWLVATRQLYIDTLDDWPGVEAGRRWSNAIATGLPGNTGAPERY